MKSGRPRRPGKALKGAEAPHLFEGFPETPGPARPQKRTPKNSGQTAFRYPAQVHDARPPQVSGIYSMLRNSASGSEIGLLGRILAGLLPGKHQNRPSGRPKASRSTDFGAFPAAVRPKSGPEGVPSQPSRKEMTPMIRGNHL